MGKHKKWTEEENEQLSEMYGSIPVAEICAHFGLFRHSIECQAKKLGLVREVSKHDCMQRLEKAMEAGPGTSQEIADRMGQKMNGMSRILSSGYLMGICYISDQVIVKGHPTNIWSPGADEHRIATPKPKRQKVKIKPFRHPFDIALFGAPV